MSEPIIANDQTFAEVMQTATASALRDLVDGGKLQSAIQQAITKTVEIQLREALSTLSPFGRALEKKLSKSLEINLDVLGVEAYRHVILGIVRERLDHAVNQDAAEKIKAAMDEILAGPVPAQITLSDFVRQFCKENRNKIDEHTTPTLHVSKQTEFWRQYWRVAIDPKSDKSEYDCELQLGTTDIGKIYFMRLHDRPIKDSYLSLAAPGWERFLFLILAHEVPLIVTDDEIRQAQEIMESCSNNEGEWAD